MSRIDDIVWALDNEQPFARTHPMVLKRPISEIELWARTVEISPATIGALVVFGATLGDITWPNEARAARRALLDLIMAYVHQERDAMVDAMCADLSHQPAELVAAKKALGNREEEALALCRQTGAFALPRDAKEVRLVNALLRCLDRHDDQSVREEAYAVLAQARGLDAQAP